MTGLSRIPLLAGLTTVLLLGCGRPDRVVTHHVPTQDVVEASFKDRMLAGIVRNESEAWFFKMTGASSAVAAQAEPFEKLLASVQFSRGEPKWDLPAGWEKLPPEKWKHQDGANLRHATLRVESLNHPLDVAVSKLPIMGGNWDQFLLANVNRWLDQLGQPKVDASGLGQIVRDFPGRDGPVFLVNIEGRLRRGAAPMRGPFAGQGQVQDKPRSPAEKIVYETPTGWQPGELETSRGGITITHKAAFQVVDESQRLDVTVDILPGSGEPGILANVIRWRGQVKLEPASPDEIREQLQDYLLGGTAGHFVELTGPEGDGRREKILGVIAARGDWTWFIKAKGDLALVDREKDRFESFVRSIKFTN